MKTQQEQLTLFLDSINEEAKTTIDNIIHEADEFREKELDKARLEAAKESHDFIWYESEKIKTQTNRMISDKAKEHRKILLDKRSSIADSVFGKVAEKLAAFSKTQEYKELLLDSVIKFSESSEERFTVFVNSRDSVYSEILMKAAPSVKEVKIDDNIALGGCRAVFENGKIELDDTLDARLEREREWFFANSGLNI